MYRWSLIEAVGWLLAIAMAAAACAQQPKGRQHLVNPGDEWSQLDTLLRPGDEIILLPGTHRPAVLDNLQGSSDLPIVIRSLSPDHVATIDASLGVNGPSGGRYGLQVKRAQHVVIHDLVITRATVHGLEISGTRAKAPDQPTQEMALTVRNVAVSRIGPIGRRNGLLLRDLNGVIVEGCDFRGWGGSAIEMIACVDASVEDCTFTGLDNYGQINAVQIRAGSRRIRVSQCVMNSAGITGVFIGGSSQLKDFRQQTMQQPLHEASRVRVTGNLFRGGGSVVTFMNCDQASVRNNTIISPQRWVYLLLDRDKSHLAATGNSNFSVNLIHWEPGDLEQLTLVNEHSSPESLTLEQNLWWSSDLSERRGRLGEPAGISQFPQIMDIDPRLDEQFVPTAPKAVSFGRDTP